MTELDIHDLLSRRSSTTPETQETPPAESFGTPAMLDQIHAGSWRELEAIAAAALDGFWCLDSDGRLVEVNEVACNMLGYTRAELLGMRVWDIETGRGRQGRDGCGWDVTRFTSQHRRKDGRTIDVEVSCQALPRNDHRWVLYVRDVTTRRVVDEELREAKKLEAVGRLAAGIAHDFGNLLTVMLSSSDFALAGAPHEGPLRDDILEFRAAAQKGRALTQQLLAFGRRQALEPRLVNLNDLIQGATRFLGRLLDEGICVRTRLEPDLAPTFADPSQIHQVLVNLAINAQDAMGCGGTLTIETANVTLPPGPGTGGLAAGGPCVLLAVEDTGHGMDSDTCARIFEPFFSTKAPERGTGLGLSVVLGIVEQSGGSIRVSSEPGVGTRFEVHLPVAALTELEAPPRSEAEQPVDGETVLVVEDDGDVLRSTVRMLQEAGFDAVGASSLEESMQVLDAHARSPSVLLSDVRMPGHGGPEVAVHLSARIPGLRTIFMSGYPIDPAHPSGAPSPGTPFLQKPFSRGTLVLAIGKALKPALPS